MENDGAGPLLRLRHRAEYVAMAMVGALFKGMPRGMALALGACLGQLGWWLRIRRRKVLGNIGQALPHLSPAERRRLAASAARNFGRTVAEFLRFSGRDRRRVMDLVHIEGLETLTDALEQGRGAILVTGHLGAWALYVTALGTAGIPSTLLVGVQSNPWVNQLILGIPGEAAEFISKGRLAPRRILKSLRAGRVIVMVADHYSSDQKVYAPFLGRPAYTLPLPGALVARHGLPLLGMAGHRAAGGRHRLVIEPIPVPAMGDPDAMQMDVATRCNRFLGEAVLAHPDQYFWYHDRWKVRRPPAGAPRVTEPLANPSGPASES